MVKRWTEFRGGLFTRWSHMRTSGRENGKEKRGEIIDERGINIEGMEWFEGTAFALYDANVFY